MNRDVDYYVARLVIPKADGKNSVGTAFPIKQGVLLTAKHNVCDKSTGEKIFPEVIWQGNIVNPSEEKSPVEDIQFIDDIEGPNIDLAILYAKTPECTPKARLRFSVPESHTSCTVYGFPRSAESAEGRKLESDSGKVNGKISKDFRMKITVDAERDHLCLWKGISGGPVFDSDNRLMGVIYETPNVSEKQDSNNLYPQAEVKSTIYAVSIPFLLDQSSFFKSLVLSGGEGVDENRNLIMDEFSDLAVSSIYKQLISPDINDVAEYYCCQLLSVRWRNALKDLAKLSHSLLKNNVPGSEGIMNRLLSLSVSCLYQIGVVNFNRVDQVAATPLSLDIGMAIENNTSPYIVHRSRRSNLETVQGKGAIYCKDLSVKEAGIDLHVSAHETVKALDLAVGLLHHKVDPDSKVGLTDCSDEHIISILDQQIEFRNELALDEQVYLARSLDDKCSNITDDIKAEIQKMLPSLPIGEYDLQPDSDEEKLIAIVIQILKILKGK